VGFLVHIVGRGWLRKTIGIEESPAGAA
jgi:hypothetical protein